jgi:murein DD-endopeptidase MepM/ murein hydrolase activator NlpD
MGRHTSTPARRRPSPHPVAAPIPFAQLRERFDECPVSGHRAQPTSWARLGLMTAAASTVVLTTAAGIGVFAQDPVAAHPRDTRAQAAAPEPAGAAPRSAVAASSAPSTTRSTGGRPTSRPTGTPSTTAPARIGDSRQQLVVPAHWSTPVVGAAVTTCFCTRWGKFHDGIDLAAPLGTPIHAAGAGTVVKVGPMDGYGQTIFIRHGNGDVSFYGHMAEVNVTLGQKVKAGQVIAPVGSEGFSTGPHLHFSVYRGGVTGPAIDPEPWLAERGVKVG